MEEKGFVDALIKTVRSIGGAYHRAVDSYTMGVPDLILWVPSGLRHRPWAFGIEAKQLRPLMDDPFHRGRRVGQMLHHEFTGPQISFLRKMVDAGAGAYGLVRASDDTAFRFDPQDIPATTGNFTHEEMIALGKPVRRVDGLWRFWDEGET